MSLPPFEYLAPKSTQELTAMLAVHGAKARILAGGTDLINWMSERLVQPEFLIDLNGLDALFGIDYRPGQGMTIGAGTKIETIENDSIVKEKYYALHQAVREIGSPQVRAMASIGGNSCNASPCADTPPPLVTFGATVTLAGPDGRREMLLEEFILGNRQTALAGNEFLESFHVPEPWPGSVSRFSQIGLRSVQEIDMASVAVNLLLDADSGTVADVRIALGAVAPIPMRATWAEAILKGHAPDEETIAQAAECCGRDCKPIDDLRASADYRRYVIKVLARRTLRDAVATAKKENN